MADLFPRAVSGGSKITEQKISESGNKTLAAMWNARADDVYVLFRACSTDEAKRTMETGLAGGEFRDLSRTAPTEEQAVQQVGNNEGMSQGSKPDPRIAKLLEMQKMGMKVSLDLKPREVVEYSWEPARQFSGCVIKVTVNSAFCIKGSGLQFEGGGGMILQIGTPLASVQLESS